MSTRKQELQEALKSLEEQIKPINEELRKIYLQEAKEVKERIEKALQGNGDFTLDELTYAAYTTCDCGCGMAYPKNIGVQGAWYCSNILLGKASKETPHSGEMPFAFYEVKSEKQSSANGATTRPKEL